MRYRIVSARSYPTPPSKVSVQFTVECCCVRYLLFDFAFGFDYFFCLAIIKIETTNVPNKGGRGRRCETIWIGRVGGRCAQKLGERTEGFEGIGATATAPLRVRVL